MILSGYVISYETSREAMVEVPGDPKALCLPTLTFPLAEFLPKTFVYVFNTHRGVESKQLNFSGD